MIAFFVFRFISFLILFESFTIQSLADTTGTVSSDYGRISNIANDRIHVSSALTQTDCIRQCVDFKKVHDEYIYEDCFAYNYDYDQYTCELIHSIEPLNYIVSTELRWKNGFKYSE